MEGFFFLTLQVKFGQYFLHNTRQVYTYCGAVAAAHLLSVDPKGGGRGGVYLYLISPTKLVQASIFEGPFVPPAEFSSWRSVSLKVQAARGVFTWRVNMICSWQRKNNVAC